MNFKIKSFILVLLCFVSLLMKAEGDYFLTPLNLGEKLIMPLKPVRYSYYYRYTFRKSQIKSGKDSKLSNSYGVEFSLVGKAKNPTGSIVLNTDLDCSGYDQLVLYVRIRSGSLTIELEADTDKGKMKTVTPGIRGYHKTEEVILDLQGASKLKNVVIKLKADTRKAGMKFVFIALRDSASYQKVKKIVAQRMKDLRIERFMHDKKYKAQGKLFYNLFLTPAEAEEYRKYILSNPKYKKMLLAEAAYLKKLPAPELLYDESTTLHADGRRKRFFERYKQYDIKKYPQYHIRQNGRRIALVGFLLKDAELLRLAMRYCLTIIMAPAWADDGFMALLPDFDSGGLAFSESDTVRDIAFIMDFAGEILNLHGTQLVRSKIAMKGLSQLNFSAWTTGGHQHGNQMCHFSMGRIAAYLMLEKGRKSMSNVKAYTDLAIKDLDRVCKLYFKPDGGCIESTFYVAHTIGWLMEPYLMYATARGKKISGVVPDEINKSGNFAQIVLSTRKNPAACTIPIGLCSSCRMRPEEMAATAALVPQSAWINIFKRFLFPNKKLGLKGLTEYYYKNPMAWKLGKIIEKSKAVKVEDFTLLESCQLLQSTRVYKGQLVKFVFESLAYAIGKRQNEVGNFVLEFAGDAFAMDIPSFNNIFFGNAEWHNMLVPMKGGNLLNSIKPRKLYSQKIDYSGMRIKGSGNDKSFKAKADLTNSWSQGAFKRWVRSIDSPKPDEIIITDEYELGNKADAVSFCWQTYLPVKKKGGIVEISGRDGAAAKITVPDNCKVIIDDINLGFLARGLGLKKGHKCSRIRFVKKAKSGKIVVKVKLVYPDK